ncbi:MAG: TonB family protein, partial [Hymenobacteraceae bacterium]|nr:TonB family protein [Hymenobacteraceae bacterium]
KTFFFGLLLAAPAVHAQQAPAPASAPNIIELKAGNMNVQRHGGAPNRPGRAPVYPGGETAMGLGFLGHIKYPQAARVKQLSGIVLVNATVNVDGTVSDPVVVRSLSPECDAEAKRVVALLKGWQPASRLRQPLPVLVQLPVPFGKAGEMRVDLSGR